VNGNKILNKMWCNKNMINMKLMWEMDDASAGSKCPLPTTMLEGELLEGETKVERIPASEVM
jgi:hypothetical protein